MPARHGNSPAAAHIVPPATRPCPLPGLGLVNREAERPGGRPHRHSLTRNATFPNVTTSLARRFRFVILARQERACSRSRGRDAHAVSVSVISRDGGRWWDRRSARRCDRRPTTSLRPSWRSIDCSPEVLISLNTGPKLIARFWRAERPQYGESLASVREFPAALNRRRCPRACTTTLSFSTSAERIAMHVSILLRPNRRSLPRRILARAAPVQSS